MIRRLYALALALGVLVLALAPLHAHLTRHLWVVRTLPEHRVELGGGGLAVGDVVPILRHNPEWTLPIGWATVQQVDGDRAIARWDPSAFRWPMGRHGAIVSVDGDTVVVDLGRDAGAEVGLTLVVFHEAREIGRLRIDAVGAETSAATVVRRRPRLPIRAGLPVTEYVVRTRASPLGAAWLAPVEAALLGLVLLVWGWSWVHPGPDRAWAALAARVRGAARAASEVPATRVALHLLLAPAVPLVVVPIAYWSVPYLLGYGFVEAGLPVAQGLGLALYLAWVVARGTSPLLALWNALAYRPRSLDPRLLWALHLLVAAAFASTLAGFLRGNLNAIGGLLTGPVDGTDLLLVARYALWSLTICGCLLGYGHTVLSIPWKRAPLKGLDFTLAGWLFNAICYGPLLGGVLHHLVPRSVGPDPTVTDGPLLYGMLGAELLLNALYTASIWNLGTYFGVMADKGVRTTGFYGVVRHPSYTLEPLMFCVLMLPGFTGPAQWLVGLSYFVKYWLRSERDDQFMGLSNPDYPPYRERVPWRHVPGLY